MEAVTGALTIEDCMRDLALDSPYMIRKAIDRGELIALALKGRGVRAQVYRIDRAEWERFKASIRTAAKPAPPADDGGPRRPRKGRPRKGDGPADYWSSGGYRERGK